MKPWIKIKVQLQKFPGKGGWTYALLPRISKQEKSVFGWQRVKGFIDAFELKGYNLMSLADGRLFLPIRSEIRKKINKFSGDWIDVILYHDTDELIIPTDLLQCLEDEPQALQKFMKMPDSHKKQYIDWIFSAKKTETQIERINSSIRRILEGKFQQE